MNKIINEHQFQLNVLGNIDIYWISSIDKMLSTTCTKTNKESYFVMLVETGYWTKISADFFNQLVIMLQRR